MEETSFFCIYNNDLDLEQKACPDPKVSKQQVLLQTFFKTQCSWAEAIFKICFNNDLDPNAQSYIPRESIHMSYKHQI